MVSLAIACGSRTQPPRDPVRDESVIVVGSGIAGLATAVEAASRGKHVIIIDRWSVFGGHAVVSGGGVTMVGTPVQEAAGVVDTPELAAEDMIAWGEDADVAWVKRYTTDSRRDVHDWLTAMGVVFKSVSQLPGSRVARYHRTQDSGLGLVVPLYRNAIALGVELVWNEDVVELLREGTRVVGVKTRGMRDGKMREHRGAAVVLATGGFQSNLQRVRASWPAGQPKPARILAGSGVNSLGDGLDLAARAGAAIRDLDHQWNYSTGLPDPRFPKSERGLNAETPQSIWVNAAGARFVDESAGTKVTFPALLAQPGSVSWAILDADGITSLAIAGPDWVDRARVERDILGNPALVTRADDLDTLARTAGISSPGLRATVDAHRKSGGEFAIARPPFYAIKRYPLARKSMGGIAVDTDTHVLDPRGRVIPGLYAVGEVTGFAKINGRAALEGTFLGPSVLMGRIAGRALAPDSVARPMRVVEASLAVGTFEDSACTSCHRTRDLVAGSPGRLHSAGVHSRVVAQGQPCATCHADLHPYRADKHRSDPLLRSATCGLCHLPPK